MSNATDDVLPDGWEMVIGLEVHCELSTATSPSRICFPTSTTTSAAVAAIPLL